MRNLERDSLKKIFSSSSFRISCPFPTSVPPTGIECNQLVSRDHVFDYLASHNDSNSMTEFLMSGVPPLENSAPCPPHVISMCSAIPSVQFLQDVLLDELARYTVFRSISIWLYCGCVIDWQIGLLKTRCINYLP